MLKRSPLFTILIFLLGIVPMVAQSTGCPALVEQALNAVGDNCSDLGRNSACYGYNQVNATFSGETIESAFNIPSDRASLTELATLRTAPLDTVTGIWGVAVMNIQANLPNTLPGQGVIMMVVGDAEVRNDVMATDANLVSDPISTVTLTEANLHISPSTSSDILQTLPASEIVLVDGFNATRAWLRVVNDGTIAWIDQTQVARLGAMDTLPILGASNPTPMQAFYLSTGIGESECSEADPMIAVQSPENLTVDLTVNGVDIRVGSLITFQNVAPNTINLTVHRGGVTTVFGNAIQAGQSALGIVNENGEGDPNFVAWGESVPASPSDLELGERAQQGINNVAQNNEWAEREVDPNPPQENQNPPGEIIHIVAPGESLFGIGRLYDASLPAIVSRNGLSEPYVLFTGQELVIPNPGSGFVGLPVSPQPPETDNPTEGTCDTLRLTSPIGGDVPTERTTYYWDGVAGATQYQVNIYDQSTGQRMGSFLTQGAETNIVISAGELGVGGGMQWEVVALINGDPLCSTGLSQPLIHSSPVNPVIEDNEEEKKPTFMVSWQCGGYTELEVSWKNAGEDDTIDFVIMDEGANVFSRTRRGESGSFLVSGFGYNFSSVDASTSSGETASVTGSLDCFYSSS